MRATVDCGAGCNGSEHRPKSLPIAVLRAILALDFVEAAEEYWVPATLLFGSSCCLPDAALNWEEGQDEPG